jgi:predicted enzyme related to lactoylglutathione lyase
MRKVASLIPAMLLLFGLAGACGAGEAPNPVVFWELASNDADKSVEFFRKVFDWDIRFSEKLGFYQVVAGEGAPSASGGYIFTLKQAKLPFLTVYIEVTDIEARAERVKEAGGLVIEPPHEMPGGYWICLFNDPSGVTFAMIDARKATAK